MRGLRFQRIVLISDSKRLANQFVFPERLNLITGNDNSIGKSTLVKSLFWAIGCEPKFDQEWKSHDVKAILYFNVDGVEYVVSRYKDSVCFGVRGESLKKYPKITGQYSIDFAKAVSFHLKLANRSGDLECPPPAYYFLPFYIDQEKSWSEPWCAFESLSQFARFKPILIKYFCGYIKPEHFDIEEDLFVSKELEREAEINVARISSAIDVIEEFSRKSGENSVAISEEEFDGIKGEIIEELKGFVDKQAETFDAQLHLRSEIYDLEQQLSIALASVRELDEDYAFAVESVPEDDLECPLCGTVHDNSLASRAGLLVDKSTLEDQSDVIRKLLKEKQDDLVVIDKELSGLRKEVVRINDKYGLSVREEGESDACFEQAVYSIAQKNVSLNISKEKEAHELQCMKARDEQKSLKAAQRKLTTKKEREELNELFIGHLTENIQALSALGVSLHGVKSPMHYKKLLGGGAAESTRGVLAYQLALLKQIEHVGNCSLAPFVIDTPNQQEQAEHRYQKVVEVIRESVSRNFQVILCGMDSEVLLPFKGEANVIVLDGGRLLKRSHYKSLRSEYERVVLGV